MEPIINIIFEYPIISVFLILFVVFVLFSIAGSLVGITLDIISSIFGLIVGLIFLLAILEIFGIVIIDNPMINPFIDLFASFLVELYNLILSKLFSE